MFKQKLTKLIIDGLIITIGVGMFLSVVVLTTIYPVTRHGAFKQGLLHCAAFLSVCGLLLIVLGGFTHYFVLRNQKGIE